VGRDSEPVESSALTTRQGADSKQKHYDGNHTQPYGSWTDPASGKEGYECCHSAVKNSYCTGQAGRDAQKASDLLNLTNASSNQSKSEGKRTERERSRSRSVSSSSSRSSFSDSDSDVSSVRHRKRRRHAKGYQSRKDVGEGAIDDRLDKRKLKDALRHEHDQLTDGSQAEKPEWLIEAEQINARNKDKYRSLNGGGDEFDVTEEQLEAYRMKNRNRTEDPMANYKDDENDV
jgi:pre-mRNA-processing factor SLU7